jgi:hypothetical protein
MSPGSDSSPHLIPVAPGLPKRSLGPRGTRGSARGCLELTSGYSVLETPKRGVELHPPLRCFCCTTVLVLPDEPAGQQTTGHEQNPGAEREQRGAAAGLRQFLGSTGLGLGLGSGGLGLRGLGLGSRSSSLNLRGLRLDGRSGSRSCSLGLRGLGRDGRSRRGGPEPALPWEPVRPFWEQARARPWARPWAPPWERLHPPPQPG